MLVRTLILFVFMFFSISATYAEDRIELETTRIIGNKELPGILYIVPWKDVKKAKHNEQRLVLHSLFGDLFDPVLPDKGDTLVTQ